MGSPDKSLGLLSAAPPRPAARHAAWRVPIGRSRVLHVLEVTREPLVLALSLWAVTLAIDGAIGAPEVVLALAVFTLTFPGGARLSLPPARAVRDSLVSWTMLSGLLFLLGHATHYIDYFQRDTLAAWWWTAAAGLVASHFLLASAAPAIRRLDGRPKRALLAGMNGPGLELARRLRGDVYADVELLGFVDDRSPERLGAAPDDAPFGVLGPIGALPELVQRHRVEIVYLALPMASQPRIRVLLEALNDTTASVYFVPDMFVTDLIQGRIDSVSGMPVVGVRDTPFAGVDGLVKRGSDMVLSFLILVLTSPLLVLLALSVRVSSPGPVIFRQRRYGLDGREIVVYKFRTMRVTEDGAQIQQCAPGDPRVTRLGGLMRRTSLDELPQLVNVLQGRMSLVGPRPHAVAHNELYRRLIKGYMLRHKVRPGITGWAQVNGCRGETDTIDKMRARVAYDLDYLRHWSLGFDLYILARTAWVVLKGQNAH